VQHGGPNTRYFEKAWQRSWLDLDEDTAEALKERGVDINDLRRRLKFRIGDGDGDGVDDFEDDVVER
jgi:hypothetical protein